MVNFQHMSVCGNCFAKDTHSLVHYSSNNCPSCSKVKSEVLIGRVGPDCRWQRVRDRPTSHNGRFFRCERFPCKFPGCTYAHSDLECAIWNRCSTEMRLDQSSLPSRFDRPLAAHSSSAAKKRARKAKLRTNKSPTSGLKDRHSALHDQIPSSSVTKSSGSSNQDTLRNGVSQTQRATEANQTSKNPPSLTDLSINHQRRRVCKFCSLKSLKKTRNVIDLEGKQCKNCSFSEVVVVVRPKDSTGMSCDGIPRLYLPKPQSASGTSG